MRVLEQLQLLRADEMLPLVANPNSMDAATLDLLKASLLAHGVLENFVLQSGTNIVVGGNHRLLALKELIAEGQLPADMVFPAGVFAFTEAQLKKASIALNKISGQVGAAALRDFLTDVPFADELDLASAGLTAEELDFLMATPWDDTDIFDRSYIVKGKRPPHVPGSGNPPPPEEPPVLTNRCPECGAEW